ncbi:MAG: FAD/NAD(P)-binding protein [Myxococcota bacterium]|nr:FAD/NAD(P)-binding protein [Myxococcota bacterium]
MSAPALPHPMLPEPARIVEKRSFGADIHAYSLRLLDPAARPRFDFLPGQFNMVSVAGVGEVAISVSSDPYDEDLEHTIRIVGRTTRVIDRLDVGDVIGVRGPYGRGWPLHEARFHDLLVVTGGVGCAPVTGAIDYVFRRRRAYGHVSVLHGVKKPEDLVHRSRFEAWRREPDAEILLTADHPDRTWRDRSGVVTELFEEVPLEPERTMVFLCGPEVMIRAAARTLGRRGVRPERIFVSLERHMQCGIGQCGHCQLGPLFVCREGPIFPWSRVSRLLGVRGL